MIDLKQVHETWQRDCVIESTDLVHTSRQTPILHSKYLQHWSTAKLELKRAEMEQKTLLKDKCCLLYTSPSPRDRSLSRMPSSA